MNGRWWVVPMALGLLVCGALAAGCSSRQCPSGYHEENGECVTDQNPNRNPEDGPGHDRKPSPTPGG